MLSAIKKILTRVDDGSELPYSIAPHIPGQQSFLIVFDVDHTIVDCNLDKVVPEYLGRGEEMEELLQQYRSAGDSSVLPSWLSLIDTLIAPFSEAQLREAVTASVVIDPDMPKMFDLLSGLQRCGGKSLLEVHLASDANALFIDACLSPKEKKLISTIHTNPYEIVKPNEAPSKVLQSAATTAKRTMMGSEAARDEQFNHGKVRQSRLHPYELDHQCRLCLSEKRRNMCKSNVLHRILDATSLIDPTIIYIGDGVNDYCPVRNVLRPRDVVLARENYPLHERLSAEGCGCTRIKLWSSAADLYQHFVELMGVQVMCGTPTDAGSGSPLASPSTPLLRLPVTARFRDVKAEEFRSLTLSKRLPSILARQKAANQSEMTTAGLLRFEELTESVSKNLPVPLLVGQTSTPRWLQNFASVDEFDAAGDPAGTRPRWGQLPWLHGEIYLYHLIWQAIMLKEEPNPKSSSSLNGITASTSSSSRPHHITPFLIDFPLHCCPLSSEVETKSIQDASFLARRTAFGRSPVGVSFGGGFIRSPGSINGEGESCAYNDITPAEGEEMVAPSTFLPYRDIFHSEKKDVTISFIKHRIVPMISCEPWRAIPLEGAAAAAVSRTGKNSTVDPSGLLLLPVLLRWMLWGNGVDLSMFTLEELTKGVGEGASSASSEHRAKEGEPVGLTDQEVLQHRHAETVLMEKMEKYLVGDELSGLRSHLECVLANTSLNETRAPALETNHIDIVMDNVGVEAIADLLFGLWFLKHSSTANGRRPPTVTYHVKPLPYYISDVTAMDFEVQLSLLEQEVLEEHLLKGSSTSSGSGSDKLMFSEGERESVRQFIHRVREAFDNGHFRMATHFAWAQPSEYRELPPTLISSYFFNSFVVPPVRNESESNNSRITARRTSSVPPGGQLAHVYRANKHRTAPLSSLVIFKGDLNYRRLVGDRHWCATDFGVSLYMPSVEKKEGVAAPALPTADETISSFLERLVPEEEKRKRFGALFADTPPHCLVEAASFQTIISGYWPTQCVAVASIRTIKSECCVGVPKETKLRLDQEVGASWRVSGKYGEILFAS